MLDNLLDGLGIAEGTWYNNLDDKGRSQTWNDTFERSSHAC